jgi:hypothetical protein
VIVNIRQTKYNKIFNFFYLSKTNSSSSIFSGLKVGSYLFTGIHSLLTKNFVKFQTISPFFLQVVLIFLTQIIASLFFIPTGFSTGCSFFKYVNKGCSSSQLTSILEN